MQRRTFVAMLAGGLLAAPLAAGAQPAGAVYRVGILANVPLTDPGGAVVWGAFVQGFRDLGYEPGRNIVLEGISVMASDVTLLKALVALVPAGVLFAGSAVLFFRGRTVGTLLQLLGAGCLVVVVLAHVVEALHLLPWMRWGFQDSPGHYLDLFSAILGLTLFPAGYLAYALRSD